MKAQEMLKNVKVVNPNSLNVLDLIIHDKVFFTVTSLQEFTELFLAVSYQKEKPKWESNESIEKLLNVDYKLKDADPKPVFNPEKGFETNFAFLQGYYEMYQKLMVNGENNLQSN
jgi:predicted nucleic acid-binding protein